MTAAVVLLGDRPVPVAVPDPQGAAAAACARLAPRLPPVVDGADRRDTTPASPLTAAWGDTPVVLRCGVGQPAALTLTSQLTTVDGVDWLPERLAHGVRFTTIGRVAYVEVSVPDTYAPEAGPLTDLSDAVIAAVPPAPADG